jgi:hypothetical protein
LTALSGKDLHNLFVKTILNKISVYFLLIIAIIPFAFLLFLQIKQQVIRHRMKESLELHFLKTISLSPADVHWIKTGKEILVTGNMFDVKSFIIENGQYKFTGLFDYEETALVKQLEQSSQKSNEPGNHILTNLFQLLQLVYSNENTYQFTKLNGNTISFHHFNTNLTALHKKVPTPPPQS